MEKGGKVGWLIGWCVKSKVTDCTIIQLMMGPVNPPARSDWETIVMGRRGFDMPPDMSNRRPLTGRSSHVRMGGSGGPKETKKLLRLLPVNRRRSAARQGQFRRWLLSAAA